MPRFKIIGLPVLEKIFKSFYHTWAWRPSWSCDLDLWTIYINFRSPFPRRLHINLALIGPWVSEEKMFEHCGRRTPDHGYPISSPCEPEGSGELKRQKKRRKMGPWRVLNPRHSESVCVGGDLTHNPLRLNKKTQTICPWWGLNPRPLNYKSCT